MSSAPHNILSRWYYDPSLQMWKGNSGRSEAPWPPFRPCSQPSRLCWPLPRLFCRASIFQLSAGRAPVSNQTRQMDIADKCNIDHSCRSPGHSLFARNTGQVSQDTLWLRSWSIHQYWITLKAEQISGKQLSKSLKSKDWHKTSMFSTSLQCWRNHSKRTLYFYSLKASASSVWSLHKH